MTKKEKRDLKKRKGRDEEAIRPLVGYCKICNGKVYDRGFCKDDFICYNPKNVKAFHNVLPNEVSKTRVMRRCDPNPTLPRTDYPPLKRKAKKELADKPPRAKTGYKKSKNGNGRKRKKNGNGNGNGNGATYKFKPSELVKERQESKRIVLEAMRPVIAITH